MLGLQKLQGLKPQPFYWVDWKHQNTIIASLDYNAVGQATLSINTASVSSNWQMPRTYCSKKS